MNNKLSELFWYYRIELMDDRGIETFYMRQNDVKTYGEIKSLEAKKDTCIDGSVMYLKYDHELQEIATKERLLEKV